MASYLLKTSGPN